MATSQCLNLNNKLARPGLKGTDEGVDTKVKQSKKHKLLFLKKRVRET